MVTGLKVTCDVQLWLASKTMKATCGLVMIIRLRGDKEDLAPFCDVVCKLKFMMTPAATSVCKERQMDKNWWVMSGGGLRRVVMDGGKLWSSCNVWRSAASCNLPVTICDKLLSPPSPSTSFAYLSANDKIKSQHLMIVSPQWSDDTVLDQHQHQL